jgi:hypothetical protein
VIVAPAAGRAATFVFKDEGLVLPGSGSPWHLGVRRQWGQDLEVGMKLVCAPEGGAHVMVDFGGALGGCRVEGIQFRASGRGIGTTFMPYQYGDRPPAAPEAVWVTGGSAASQAARIWPEKGECDLRIAKRGPVLRLEANGLCLAELILSERDERELAARTVRLQLGGGRRTGAGPDTTVSEFRAGRIRSGTGPGGN